MRRSPSGIGLLIGLVALASAEPARATDTWSKPFPGVKLLHRTKTNPNQNIFALVVNLCADGVRLRARKPHTTGIHLSTFGSGLGAQAVINGDFATYANWKPTGLAIGGGEHWPGTSDPNWEGFIAFGQDRAALSPEKAVVTNPPSWMTNVVSGRPQVLIQGKVITTYNCSAGGDYCSANPRTAYGFSKDQRTLYLAVVDGRSAKATGMTTHQVGVLMKSLGAYDAINTNGGGNSEIWMEGKGVVNDPSDGVERADAIPLAIFASGKGPAGSCIPNPGKPDGGAGGSPDGGPTETGGGGSGIGPDTGGGGSGGDAPTEAPATEDSEGDVGCSIAPASDPADGFPALLVAAFIAASRRRSRRSS